MIRAKLPDRTLGITFKHVPAFKTIGYMTGGDGQPDKNQPIKREIRTTKCEIYEVVGEDARLVGHATAECSPLDNFEKATGRKVALTKALAWMKMGKEDRSHVWEAYQNRG